MGLPHLCGTNLAKVQAANKLYDFGARLLFLCFQLNILVSVENPSRSWLWGILTSLAAAMNDPAFTEWFAALVPTDFHACMHGGKPLIPEFKEFCHLDAEQSKPGYRLLATPLQGAQQTELPSEDEGLHENRQKRPRKTFKYGVQWKPEEFLEHAKAVLHPKDPQKALPLALKEAVIHVMGSSPVEVAKHRLSVVLALHKKAAELSVEEQQLKTTMDSQTAHVLANKRLCLWRYLLETTGFADMQVVDLVTNGIPLYGCHTKPPNFPDDWKPSLISVDELLDSSVWRRKALMGAEQAKVEDSVQSDLHEATMKEVALGHLHGPYSEQEITEHFGSDKWLFNPRFALYQGSENKVRAIDDGKRSALNLAFTTNFKLELYDVDTLAALVASVADSLRTGRVSFDMDDDTVCSVPVHPEVASDGWSGRTLDLSRAYKQLALDKASRCLSVVGYHYKGRWVFFRCDVLPFWSHCSRLQFQPCLSIVALLDM